MQIKQMLSQKERTISFELFPPKPGGDMLQMQEVVNETAALKPDFISVTYGASGSTSKNTLKVAEAVQTHGVTALAHLTCVSSTKEEIANIVERIREKGIENILALRGDIPENMEFPTGERYRYASELIEKLKQYNDVCIGAACYPEGHIESENRERDIDFLKQKVDAGCDFLTTQMFFDNNILYRFLYRILAKDIKIPVLAGIMPVTNKKQITRIIKMSGTVLPQRFLAIMDKFGEDPAAMQQAGVAYATEQIIDLIANGVKGIHLYTMNKPHIAAQIMNNLSHIIGGK